MKLTKKIYLNYIDVLQYIFLQCGETRHDIKDGNYIFLCNYKQGIPEAFKSRLTALNEAQTWQILI